MAVMYAQPIEPIGAVPRPIRPVPVRARTISTLPSHSLEDWILDQAQRTRDRQTQRWLATQAARGREDASPPFLADWAAADAAEETRKTRALQDQLLRAGERLASKERDRLERLERPASPPRESELARAWGAYQRGCAELLAGNGRVAYRAVPWPVMPHAALTRENIALLVLSPAHSGDRSRRARLRDALRIWHPDRCWWLKNVLEQDRTAVADSVGIVARCLNELLALENDKRTRTPSPQRANNSM